MTGHAMIAGRVLIDSTTANGVADAEVDLSDVELTALQMPAAWTAAALTVLGRPTAQRSAKAANQNDALQNVYDSGGTEVSITVAAARFVVLTAAHRDALYGLRAIKLRSGTSGVPVQQAADREIILIGIPRG